MIKFYKENEGDSRVPNKERVRNKGVWEVEDGAVIGGQVPGSIAGSYLISKKTYGDFELTLEANFPIDPGIMVRAHKLGSVGYQLLIDNRPNGSIGGVCGNSVGSFLAWPFTIDGDEEPGNRIANIREGVVESNALRGGKFKSDYSGAFAEFNKAWKPNDWNKIKVRCTGRQPLIETWVNGVRVSRLDTATLADVVPNYDAEAIFKRIGRKGQFAFEVHDSPTRNRWAPGAKRNWRNVQIRELEIAPKVVLERQALRFSTAVCSRISGRENSWHQAVAIRSRGVRVEHALQCAIATVFATRSAAGDDGRGVLLGMLTVLALLIVLFGRPAE